MPQPLPIPALIARGRAHPGRKPFQNGERPSVPAERISISDGKTRRRTNELSVFQGLQDLSDQESFHVKPAGERPWRHPSCAGVGKLPENEVFDLAYPGRSGYRCAQRCGQTRGAGAAFGEDIRLQAGKVLLEEGDETDENEYRQEDAGEELNFVIDCVPDKTHDPFDAMKRQDIPDAVR